MTASNTINMDNAEIIVYIDSSLEGLISGYLENRRRDLIAIRAVLTRNNFEPVRVIGHNIKGTGSGYGFDFISKVGDELEQAALRADSAAIIRLSNELDDYLGRLKVVFD